MLRRIMGLLKPYKMRMLTGFALQTVVILTRLLMPRLTATMVNDVITAKMYERLYPLCIAILVLTVIRGACVFSRLMIIERVSQDVDVDVRTSLYDHLQEMPWEFYDKNRVGEIMSRMTGDLNGVRMFIAGTLIGIYENSLSFIGSLIFMMFMSWQVTLMVFVMTPILGGLAWVFNKKIRPIFRDAREQNATLNTRTQEDLAGMHVVKAFAREDYEEERFRKDNRDLLDKNMRASYTWSNFMPFMEMLSGLCTPVALLGGMLMVKAGNMDIGTLVGVTGYIWMLTNPMRQIPNLINAVAQASTSAEKLFYYMDFGSSIKEPADAKQPEEFRGHVVFDHVTFGYGDKPVLKDICLEAKPGETIAIMGATGAGKSTLVTLMGRFYDIASGSLMIDGIDVRKQKLKPLRRKIGFCMQDTFLFSDTVEENIRYGAPEADIERVKRSAHVAQADEFIDGMPQGYETVVGERGVGMSGGQKQRTSIARAVLIDPAILVLDDSTSAVDMETEYEIQQQLKEVLKNRTTFIIAHRISSVKSADQIIVLKDGEIAERGRHRELIEKGGIYAQMVADQMSSAVKV